MAAENRSLARFILIVAIAAWIFRAFVIAPFNIPSGSMLPTLYIGDYLAVVVLVDDRECPRSSVTVALAIEEKGLPLSLVAIDRART